jgi:hypothetical protein
MYNYVKTMSDLSEENQLSFIATKEIRMIAAYEMLNVRAYQMKNRYDIEYGEKGLGSSTEFKGV